MLSRDLACRNTVDENVDTTLVQSELYRPSDSMATRCSSTW